MKTALMILATIMTLMSSPITRADDYAQSFDNREVDQNRGGYQNNGGVSDGLCLPQNPYGSTASVCSGARPYIQANCERLIDYNTNMPLCYWRRIVHGCYPQNPRGSTASVCSGARPYNQDNCERLIDYSTNMPLCYWR